MQPYYFSVSKCSSCGKPMDDEKDMKILCVDMKLKPIAIQVTDKKNMNFLILLEDLIKIDDDHYGLTEAMLTDGTIQKIDLNKD